MSETKPSLQKPPGYRDPGVPVQRPTPRKPNLPPSFYPQKKRRSCCCRCCCCFFIFILIIVILFALASALFYVWFEPRLPVFHLKALQIPKFNVTSSPDGMVLDAQTEVTVEAKNPNSQLKVVYARTRVYLKSEDGLDLGSASLPGFTQEKKNVTVLKFTTQVKNTLVGDGVGTRLKDGFKSKNLMVSTEVRSGVGMAGKGWNSGTVEVKVICGAMSLKQMENGDMPKCHINVLKWINI